VSGRGQAKGAATMSSEAQDHPVAVENAGGTADPSDPEAIRAQIEVTRSKIEDTVEALAAKTDVKEQAREKVAEIGDRVAEMTPEDVRSAADSMLETVRNRIRERPAIAVAVGGLVLLWLLRRRR
jgi:uncharacterized protein (TIGR03382 family)